MKLGAVLNPAAGTLAAQGEGAREQLVRWLSERVDPKHTRWLDDGDARAEARRLLDRGVGLLIAGGGDGTVSAVAAVAAEARVPLAVLPLGTHNHFARDLRLPTQLAAAIEVIDHPHRRAVDLGEINGRTFINNVSIGMYPFLVLQRAEYQQHRGWSKRPAQVAATVQMLRRFPRSRLDVELDGRTMRRHTPVFFVGNNAYSGGVLANAHRETLDAGKLWVCVARPRSKLALLRACWGFMTGRLEELPDLETALVDSLTVRSRTPSVTAAIDGDTFRMKSPLHIRIRPAGLEVLIP